MKYETRIWKGFKLIGSINTYDKELAETFLKKYYQSKGLYYIEMFVDGRKIRRCYELYKNTNSV